MGPYHSESLKVIRIDIYIIVSHNKYLYLVTWHTNNNMTRDRKLTFFQKALVYKRKASIYKGKEIHLQM